MRLTSSLEIAVRAFQKHVATHPLTHYTGILSLHGFARLAQITGNPAVLADCRRQLLPFVAGERPFKANFTNYYCGGNGTAYLLWQGALPEAEATVRHYAEEFYRAPRDEGGILTMPGADRPKIWIDVAFAVTPFMLFAGLTLGEETYIEAGFQQIKMMYDVFRDPANGLLHQARGFTAPGVLSQDHWSRGNGWGILALAELAQYLPAGHPRRPAAEQMFTDLLDACLRHQDADGMWHQEITDHDSYVETSGTGLILYALGVALAQKLVPAAAMDAYVAGLTGYLQYIRPDGTVYHTCRGCLNPGQGTITDYKQRAPVVNDPHAFGPVTLAFGQALRLGISEVVNS